MPRDAAKTYKKSSDRTKKRMSKRNKGEPLNERQLARADKRAGRRTERRMAKSRGQEYKDKQGRTHAATGTGTQRAEKKGGGKKGYKSTKVTARPDKPAAPAPAPAPPQPQAPAPAPAPYQAQAQGGMQPVTPPGGPVMGGQQNVQPNPYDNSGVMMPPAAPMPYPQPPGQMPAPLNPYAPQMQLGGQMGTKPGQLPGGSGYGGMV